MKTDTPNLQMHLEKYPIFCKKTAILLLIFSFALAVQAQWSTSGPYGGAVYCSQKIGRVLYVGTDKGIFQSSDSGQSWKLRHQVVANFSVTNLFFDDTVLYAYLYTSLVADKSKGGVYISTDTGKTWSQKFLVIGKESVTEFVKVHNKVFARNEDGTFYTKDHGQTWVKLTLPLYLSQKLHAAGNTLFKTAHYSNKIKLYRSIDDGQNWTKADSGLGGSNIYFVYKIGSTLYGFSYPLTYTSTDDGVSWQKMTFKPSLNPSNGNQFGPEKMCYNGQYFFASNGGNLHVETARISPGDTQWIYINTGLKDQGTYSLFAFNATVFISKDEDLYTTNNQGNSWSLLPMNGLSAIPTFCVLANGNNVHCGSSKKGFYSTDNGNNWGIAPFNTTVYQVNDMYQFGSKLFSGTNGTGIFSSADNGKTWNGQKLPDKYIYRFIDDGSSLYVGSDKTVYKSIDNGNSWVEFSTGIPADAVVSDVKVLGSNIYACVGTGPGGKQGLYKSALSSPTWSLSGNGLGSSSVISLEKNNNVLFVGTANSGVYKSTDFGSTWVPLNNGISKREVADLTSDGSSLYAATDLGLWELPLTDTVWKNITGNLPIGKIQSVSVGSSNIFVATSGSSIWQKPGNPAGLKPIKENTTLKLYPNPTNNSLFIQSTEIIESIKMFDLNGKEIFSKFVNKKSTQLEISNYSDGIYFIQIFTVQNKTNHKIIIQH